MFKISTQIAEIVQQLLNGKQAGKLPAGFKFNAAKVATIVKQTIISPKTANAIKKIINAELEGFEQEYRTSLDNMMTGNSTDGTRASRDFMNKVRSQFKPSRASLAPQRWIMQAWGGDWYAYKRSLAGRRLVKTGKKDKYGKPIYQVYAGKLNSSTQSQIDRTKSSQYFNVGQFVGDQRSKRFSKTLRSTQDTKSGKKGAGSIYSEQDTTTRGNFTKRLNPAKVGRRAARQTGLTEKSIQSYAVARSVQLAEDLRNGGQINNTKGKSGRPKGKVPYAKTGKMADSYSRTFSYKPANAKVVANSSGNLEVTISGEFKLSSMAAEYRRSYLRTPVGYKRLLVNSSGNLFAELVSRRLQGKI